LYSDEQKKRCIVHYDTPPLKHKQTGVHFRRINACLFYVSLFSHINKSFWQATNFHFC
jgi:hypothetical protein